MNRPTGSPRLLAALLALGLLALLPGKASAFAYTWFGSTNNSWAVSSGNWTGAISFPGNLSSTDTAEFGPAAIRNFIIVEQYNVTVASIFYTAPNYQLYIDTTGSLTVTDGISATTANAASVTLVSNLYLGGASTIKSLSDPISPATAGSLSTTGVSPATLNIVGNGGSFSGRLTESTAPLSVTIGDGVNAASQTLSGTANYTGATTVQSQATLTAGSDDALSFTSSHVINGTLAINTGSSTIGALSGAGVVNLGSNALTVLGGGQFTGAITGAGGTLIKAGGGNLILAGDSDYTGPTFVNSGTLQVDGLLTSDVTVRNGATLAGDGIVNDIVLESGAVLIPIDCLDGETLTWNPDATLAYTLGDDPAIIELAGDFLRGGLFGFDFTLHGYGDLGQEYTLLTFSGATDFLTEDFTFTGGPDLDGFFTLADNALTFTVTAVPEPTSALLGLAGLLVLLPRRRARVFRLILG